MKKRILFVDDELFILAGLKRTLATLAPQYDFDFAGSGREALAKLKERLFDVVVTDIKMPVMTGDQLISEVALLYPSTSRVILSGEVNEETSKKLTSLAHSFLAKPCETETILRTLDRLCGSSKFLSNEQVQGLLRGIKTLPTPPALYFDIQKKMQEENASLKDVASLIGRDAATSGKILKVVNSSFFGIARKITKMEEAVMLLGVNVIRSLILSCHVSKGDAEHPIPGFSLDALNHHSMLCSNFALRLSRTVTQNKGFSEEAFTIGVLHDLGILVMAEHMPENLKTTLRHMKDHTTSFVDAELQCLGATHAQIGACLLEIWGLPEILVDAIRVHHDPVSVEDLQNPSPSLATRMVEYFLKGQSGQDWIEMEGWKPLRPEVERHPVFKQWIQPCSPIFKTLQQAGDGKTI